MPLLDKNLSNDLMNLRSDNDDQHLDTADNDEAAKKLIEGFYENEELYIMYCRTTQNPFVICDEDTFEDEVLVFNTEAGCLDYSKIYAKDQYLLGAMKVTQKMIPAMLNSIFMIGADTILFSDGGAPIRIHLEDLAEGPTYPDAPSEAIPKDNPGLQLTAIYFLQKLRRPIKDRDKKQLAELKTLEEEMVVNLLRSQFIMVFDGQSKPGDKQLKIPFVKNKKGEVLQPIFTDFQEVQKFASKMPIKNVGMAAVSYDKLPSVLGKAAKAYTINPAGINLVLTPEQLKNMKSIYGEEE